VNQAITGELICKLADFPVHLSTLEVVSPPFSLSPSLLCSGAHFPCHPYPRISTQHAPIHSSIHSDLANIVCLSTSRRGHAPTQPLIPAFSYRRFRARFPAFLVDTPALKYPHAPCLPAWFSIRGPAPRRKHALSLDLRRPTSEDFFGHIATSSLSGLWRIGRVCCMALQSALQPSGLGASGPYPGDGPFTYCFLRARSYPVFIFPFARACRGLFGFVYVMQFSRGIDALGRGASEESLVAHIGFPVRDLLTALAWATTLAEMLALRSSSTT